MKAQTLIAVLRFLIILALIPIARSGFCQEKDTTIVVRVETRDGNEYVGRIVQRNDTLLQVHTTSLGLLNLRIADVVKIQPVAISQIRGDGYWFDYPQSTRYLWAPNAYGLRKGEGYYQNILVFFNHVSVGVTDHFSLGAGFIPLFLFAGAATPAWITPKVSIPVAADKFNIGAGALFGKVLGIDDTGFGLFYGLATVGNRDQNLTLGLGYGYLAGETGSTPTISLSGATRLGRRVFLLSENYYISNLGESNVMLSLAGRVLMKNAGLDFGFVFPPVSTAFVAIPWLGLTVPFGNNIKLEKRR